MRLGRFRRGGVAEARSMSLVDLQDFLSMAYNGNRYLLDPSNVQTTMGRIDIGEVGTASAVKSVPPVFAVLSRRISLFSQVQFAFKRLGASDRPMASDLFTTAALAPLDDPVDLLARIELGVGLAGNAFVVARPDGSLTCLRPDWCTIVLGSQTDAEHPGEAWDVAPIGLLYVPPNGGGEAFDWARVAHIAPKPDPDASWRGMSYLAPCLPKLRQLRQSEAYITKFYSNAATPNAVVRFPADTSEDSIRIFRDLFLEEHQGASKAFKTAFLGGGADLSVIGSKPSDLSLDKMDASAVAMLAQASGVPLPVLGIVAGLEHSTTYNNYSSALRHFADFEMRALWRLTAIKLRRLVAAPAGAELWYDATGISALQADAKDDAEVMAALATTMRTLVDGGWEPVSVTDAVTSGDLTKLRHSGNLSVQLQPGGIPSEPAAAAA